MTYTPRRPTENPTSGILALIFGIAGLVVLPLIGAVLALVFGYQCRNQVAAEPQRYSDELGRAGRILGWIGLGLVALGVLFVGAVFSVLITLAVVAGA